MPQKIPEPSSGVLDVLVFERGGGSYAVETRWVREVTSAATIIKLPGAPACFAGLIDLRGEILALADLSALLGAAEHKIEGPRPVIVLSDNLHPDLGLVADAPLKRTTLRTESLRPPAPSGDEGEPRLIRGLTEGGTALIDAIMLLGDSRMILDQPGIGGMTGSH